MKTACSADFAPCFRAGFSQNYPHVSTRKDPFQGRQRTPLLEHCGKPTHRLWPCGAAPCAVPGRDQRQPEGCVVQDHRGVRRGLCAPGATCPVPRRPGCAAVGLRRGAGQARRFTASPATAMGRLLARLPPVGLVAARRLLGRQAAAVTPRHALAECVQDAGLLPADRPRQRVAAAPPLVRTERHGGPAGRRLRPGAERQAVPLPGQAAGPQAGAVQLSAAALAGIVRCPFRRAAVRPDQHLLRVRHRRPASGSSATAATSAPIASKS